MAASSSEDPGGSAERRLPHYMDPTNKFGELTYLQLLGKNDTPLPRNPFLIGKSVEQAAGGPIENAKTEAQGTRYSLMVRDPMQVEKLMRMNTLIDGTEVVVQSHPNLNVSRCVISCFDIIDLDERDVLTGLNSQGVIRVQRITRNENGKRVNTPALILTYCRATYPEFVKIGLLRVPTRPYFPNPLLCYGCFNYGHPKVRCPGPQRCFNCSGEHQTDECNEAAYCRNCKGNHRPTSRQCPVYTHETEVIKIKVRDNLTFPEARKRAESQRAGSYAQAVAQQNASQSKIDELITLLKRRDDTITELKEMVKKSEKKLENALLFSEKLKQRIVELTASSSQPKQLMQQTGPNTRSRTNSPAIVEQKRGRSTQRLMTSKSTSAGLERESPPPKKTAVTTIGSDEDCQIDETPPSQRLR